MFADHYRIDHDSLLTTTFSSQIVELILQTNTRALSGNTANLDSSFYTIMSKNTSGMSIISLGQSFFCLILLGSGSSADCTAIVAKFGRDYTAAMGLMLKFSAMYFSSGIYLTMRTGPPGKGDINYLIYLMKCTIALLSEKRDIQRFSDIYVYVQIKIDQTYILLELWYIDPVTWKCRLRTKRTFLKLE